MEIISMTTAQNEEAKRLMSSDATLDRLVRMTNHTALICLDRLINEATRNASYRRRALVLADLGRRAAVAVREIGQCLPREQRAI